MKLMLLAAAALAFTPVALHAQQPMHHEGAMSREMPGDMHHSKPPVPPSHALHISIGSKTVTLSLADLQAMPQTTVHVHNVHSGQDETYAGPLVSDVLAKAGFSGAHENEKTILHSTVLASATDNYFVVYSAAEMEPAFSRSTVIVALTKNGETNFPGGLIQLVNTDGAKPARWVHGLDNLSISTVTSKP